jgi:hypothetical protein
MKTSTIGAHSEIRIWTDGRIFCSVFDGDITPQHITEYERIQSDFARAAPGKIVSVSFVRGGSPNVSEEVRTASLQFFGRTKAYTHCGVVVLETPGMLGVILRSVLTGILFVARTPYPFRLFGSADVAETWLNEVDGLSRVDRQTLARLMRSAE